MGEPIKDRRQELNRLVGDFDEYRKACEEELAELEEKVSALEKDNTLQRTDLEDLQNQREDLEEKVKKLLRQLREKDEAIQGLRMHGGEHWFVLAYQRSGMDHCKVCDKPRDDPSHFGNGGKALSSTAVEKAVKLVQGRLESLMQTGLGMGAQTAAQTVLEVLQGLPGIPEGNAPQEEKRERYCTCGAPESNHPYRHPFESGPPNQPEGIR